MKIEMRPIREVIPYEKNPRQNEQAEKPFEYLHR